MNPNTFLITCEHGGNEVPAEFADCFTSAHARTLLRGHRGWDPGALEAARWLAGRLNCDLISATTTRLLVDLNRSIDNPGLWSKFSRRLSEDRRLGCLARQYFPYRSSVESWIETNLTRKMDVTHLSMHTFTPRLAGTSRLLDVGLLFDPASETENRLCCRWLESLESRREGWRVAANRPYAGTDDGLTTWLRLKCHPIVGRNGVGLYRGIEIELTNRIFSWREKRRERLMTALYETLCCSITL